MPGRRLRAQQTTPQIREVSAACGSGRSRWQAQCSITVHHLRGAGVSSTACACARSFALLGRVGALCRYAAGVCQVESEWLEARVAVPFDVGARALEREMEVAQVVWRHVGPLAAESQMKS